MTKRRKKILGGLVLMIIIVVAVVLRVLSAINQPVTAALQAGTATKQTGYDIDLTPVTKVGTYVSFNYPAGLNPAKQTPFGLPIVEKFNFQVRDVESWILAISVSNIQGGVLSDSSSYSYRKAHPDIFHESHETVNGQAIDLMTDVTAGGFDQVAYIVHGSHVGIVSLIGDDSSGTAPLQQTFDMVLQSWHWL